MESERSKAQNKALVDQRQRLCKYIRNTAQVPLAVHDFDDDWTPAGEMYRDDLIEAELISVREPGEGEPGGIYLTVLGEIAADKSDA